LNIINRNITLDDESEEDGPHFLAIYRHRPRAFVVDLSTSSSGPLATAIKVTTMISCIIINNLLFAFYANQNDRVFTEWKFESHKIARDGLPRMQLKGLQIMKFIQNEYFGRGPIRNQAASQLNAQNTSGSAVF
jgi:hypothetical protein